VVAWRPGAWATGAFAGTVWADTPDVSPGAAWSADSWFLTAWREGAWTAGAEPEPEAPGAGGSIGRRYSYADERARTRVLARSTARQRATTPEGAAELVQIAAAAQGGDAQAVEVAQSIAAEVIAPMLETVAALEGERQAVLDSGQIVVPEVLDQKISDMRRAILLFVLLEYGWH
jgi:hypothetical protein